MSTCDQGFEHPDPEPVIIEEAPDTEPVADAAVEIARIEADRDVTIAKVVNRSMDEDTVATIAALQAENEALRAQLAPPEPEPEEIAVVVANADAEAAPEPESAPPLTTEETSTSEPAAKRRSNPWW